MEWIMMIRKDENKIDTFHQHSRFMNWLSRAEINPKMTVKTLKFKANIYIKDVEWTLKACLSKKLSYLSHDLLRVVDKPKRRENKDGTAELHLQIDTLENYCWWDEVGIKFKMEHEIITACVNTYNGKHLSVMPIVNDKRRKVGTFFTICLFAVKMMTWRALYKSFTFHSSCRSNNLSDFKNEKGKTCKNK